jgi:hypothetical protein
MTAALRDQLEVARRQGEPERSVSQEIERRLRLSFEMDQKIAERFGGRRKYWVFQLIADQIRYLEEVTGQSVWENAYTHTQAKACLDTVFNTLRPRGRSSIPRKLFLGFSKQYREQQARSLGERCALLAIASLQAIADGRDIPSTPFGAQNFTASGLFVSQLAKSGKSPFDDLTARWPKEKKDIEEELAKMKAKEEEAK